MRLDGIIPYERLMEGSMLYEQGILYK
jgi:hypothetical protein